MKLKEEHIKRISQMIDKTDQTIRHYGLLNYNITKMKQQKTKLLDQLDKLTDERNSLIQQISKKYGQGTIDPVSWEFKPYTDQNK